MILVSTHSCGTSNKQILCAYYYLNVEPCKLFYKLLALVSVWNLSLSISVRGHQTCPTQAQKEIVFVWLKHGFFEATNVNSGSYWLKHQPLFKRRLFKMGRPLGSFPRLVGENLDANMKIGLWVFISENSKNLVTGWSSYKSLCITEPLLYCFQPET